MRRLLVIGLQEATMDIIGPWAEQGLLPNMARMISDGVRGHVVGKLPLATPHSWANILTGMGAGRHGIYDYWQRGPDGCFRESDSGSFCEAPIWDRLRGSDLASGYVNLPLTWPVPQVNGFVVAGSGAPAVTRKVFSPPELYDGLVAATGPYRPDSVFPGGRKRADYLGLFEREIPRTTAAFERLLVTRPWQFAIVYFVDAAMAQHYFWADMETETADNPYRGIVSTAYQCLDEAIGRLVTAAGPDANVFVVSECGAGRLRFGIQINTWLEQQGLLQRNGLHFRRPWRAASDRVRRTAKRILPATIKTAIAGSSTSIRNWARSSGTVLDLDWGRTRAFSRGKEGSIFVNLKGRDPNGVVEPGRDYEAVRDAIIDDLGELKDPETNEPAASRVFRREELFEGPFLEWAPDLLVEWHNAMYMPDEQEQFPGEVFVTRWRKGMSWPTTGSHRYEGVLLAAGPGIASRVDVGDVSQLDLLPTWLQLLRQEVPTGLDGRILEEAIATG